MEDMHTPELLTIGEAARLLGLSVDTLRRWADAGRITVIILPSGHRRFRRDEIERVITAGEKAAS